MKKSLFIILCGLFLFSCIQNGKLEYALEFAGENRAVLEKVLDYYKDSTLKYRAACFLIENMPRYYSYHGWQIDSLKKLKKESIINGRISHRVIEDWSGFSYFSLPRTYDSHIISADILIENIDLAFKVWENKPWNIHYSFDEFCEYILPYRIADEPLENWRKIYFKRYDAILDSLYCGKDVVEAARAIAGYLKTESFKNYKDFELPHLGALYLLENRVGYCRENCDIAMYAMRALGIPIATDCYLSSPTYNSRHFWSAVIDTTKIAIPFNYTENELRRGGGDDRRKGKVYRTFFGAQSEKYKNIYTNTEIPILFRDPYMSDVSDEYFENSISVKIENANNASFVYLAVFTAGEYDIIDIAEIDGNKTTFHNVESGLIYHPVYYGKNKIRPAGYPFLLKNDTLIYFIPDMAQLSDITVVRKYPMRNNPRFFELMVGATIEGDNRLDFKDSKMLYEVIDTPAVNYNKVLLNSNQSYRFIRYTAPKEEKIELAELAFYSDTLEVKQLYPIAILGNPLIYEDELSDVNSIFDKDWVSFYRSQQKGQQLIFDLGQSVDIKKIIYIPRNDDNFIHIDDQYELFYQDGVNGWVSLGNRKAKESYLYYSDVPQNALFWLHNHTRGKEERPFYYKDGVQVFP